MQDYIDDLQLMQNEIDRLRAMVVSGFYEDRVPVYTQGLPTNELQSVITAAEVNGMISEIDQLRAQNARLVEALKQIVQLSQASSRRGNIARQALAEAGKP